MEEQQQPKEPEPDPFVEEEQDYLSNPFFMRITHKIYSIIKSSTKEMVLRRGERNQIYNYTCNIDNGGKVAGTLHYLFLPYIVEPAAAISLLSNIITDDLPEKTKACMQKQLRELEKIKEWDQFESVRNAFIDEAISTSR